MAAPDFDTMTAEEVRLYWVWHYPYWLRCFRMVCRQKFEYQMHSIGGRGSIFCSPACDEAAAEARRRKAMGSYDVPDYDAPDKK